MLLTIGMATVRDYDGPWATIQSLRLAMRDLAFTDYEIILVDNDPDHPRGKACAEECQKAHKHLNQGCRYIPFPEAYGTTQPRQRVFDDTTTTATTTTTTTPAPTTTSPPPPGGP